MPPQPRFRAAPRRANLRSRSPARSDPSLAFCLRALPFCFSSAHQPSAFPVQPTAPADFVDVPARLPSKGETKMTEDRHPTAPIRDVPVDWEALEDAFENNAPEVHSYLHLTTGEVLRIVDGVADPQMHARIAADPTYLRIDPVSSREQYR